MQSQKQIEKPSGTEIKLDMEKVGKWMMVSASWVWIFLSLIEGDEARKAILMAVWAVGFLQYASALAIKIIELKYGK